MRILGCFVNFLDDSIMNHYMIVGQSGSCELDPWTNKESNRIQKMGDESSSFFFIKTEPCYSSRSWPFRPHVIFHVPFKSESHTEQDGVYRF